MPFLAPVFGAIGAAFGAIGSLIGGLGAIGQVVAGIGLNVAMSFLQKALAPKPPAPPSGVDLDLQTGENVDRVVRCGRYGVAGHFIYPNTSGPANSLFQQVFVLSDFPITSLDRIYIDGTEVTLGAEHPERGRVVTSGDYANLIWIKVLDGWQTEADAALVAASNPGGRWTADHVGYGQAMVIVWMQYDRERLGNSVQFFFDGRGAPLYDLRKDSTIGGEGDHRWNDVTTWEYSENPTVIEYCYRRGFSWNGDLFCGMGMPTSDLPIDKFVTAANVDDEDVGGSPRYRCAIGLNAGPDTEFGDNIEQINLAHGARTVDAVDGSWPIVGVPQTVVATLTDDDMMSEADIEFQQLRGFDQLVNSVQGVYPDPDNQWSSKGYQRAFKAALITGDGRGRDLGINFPVVPYGEQAARLAMIYLSENRYEATAEVVVSPEWRNLKVGQWIRWNSAENGDFIYEITARALIALEADMPRAVRLSLQQRDPAIYTAPTVVSPPVVVLPGEAVYQQELVDFAAVGVIGAGANSLVYPMIRVSWSTPGDPTVAEIVVFWRVKDGPGPTFSRVIKVGTNIAVLTEGVVSETEYEVWHQLVADPARATSPTAPIGVTTPYAPSRDVEVTLGQLQTDVYGSLTNIRAILDDLSATVTDLATSSAQGQLSVQSNIQDTMAVLGDAVALVRQETRVLAKADLALAEQINSVSASLGDLLAQGLFSIQAQAGSGEVLARIVLYARASIDDDFEEAGMEFQVKSVGGVLSSQIVVNANKFVVTDGSNESLPLVFEGGELKLFVARMGKAIVDETLETSTGKTRFGNFGSPVEGIRVSS